MDFWRLYRLITSKRWLIAAIVLLAGIVVFAGTAVQSLHKEYAANAILQPQDTTAQTAEAGATGNEAPPGNNVNPAEQRITNISELLLLLRSSNDVNKRAAALLKMPEDDRRKEVFRILRKNGYFAQIDADVQSQADQAVRQGDLAAAKQADWVKEQTTKAEGALTDSLAKATDASGSFGAAGAGENESDIAERIRAVVTYESVEGPFSTDQNPQVVNQIKIVANTPRAAESELYANMVAVAFLDYYTNRSQGAVTARIELLHDKLRSAQGMYDRARNAVDDFRKSNRITDYAPVQAAALANVQQYENSLNAAKQDLAGAIASVNVLQGLYAQSGTALTTVLPYQENPQVRLLQDRVSAARIGFRKVEESNFGEESDVYKQAKGELDQAESELKKAQSQKFTSTAPNVNRQQIELQLGQAKVARDSAQNRVAALTQQLADERAKLKTLPTAAAKLADLQSEADLRQDAVRRLEKVLADQELKVIEQGRAGTVNIVSTARAELVEGMTSGKRVKIIVYGMMLALVFSVLMFVALDALDNAVKTAGDAQRLLDLSVIGQIPSHISDLMRGPRIVALDPLSPAAESYRLLRTDLLFMSGDRPFKSLLITPVRAGQGATTTAGNLAIALAQSGRRVVLVDADLRRPKHHAIFNVSNEAGLSSVLTGGIDLNNALIPTMIEGLTLLPAGTPVVNPSELIGANAMMAVHKRLRDMADFVIFDAPSPVAFADSAVLASMADATLLVLRAGQAPDGAAEQQVRDRLQKAHANVLGMVLNDIEPERLLSARTSTGYLPALTTGSLGSSAPIAALPGPAPSIGGVVIPAPATEIAEGEGTVASGETEGELGTESPKPPTRKPRIVSSTTPSVNEAATNGAGPKTVRKSSQTPLMTVLAVGLSTAVGLLTLALSRGGR